ncbi:GrpB family protein [Arthrobacter sp. UYEF36]|uniref:GrpB family protein n=1 Tax=Arthrobacter sp. UYEF36 TaxID=1756366 RepID=UPI0033957CAE
MESDSIELVPADPQGWAARLEVVRGRLASLLPDAEVEHISSTSIPDLPAKDVVDVLVGVNLRQWSTAMDLLSADGFDCEGHREGHAWFSLPNRSNRRDCRSPCPDPGTPADREIVAYCRGAYCVLAYCRGAYCVLAYCRGAYCVLAYEAVDLLHAAGRRARRLHEGMLEWRLGGLPVGAGAAA